MQPLEDDVPESFGRYEALFRIAAGGMAEVYAARLRGEAGFTKLVALKRMLPNLAEDDQFVTMFLDEARVASNISSPHVVSTLDLGRATDGSLYIIMDLVLGVTLSQILRTVARDGQMIPVDVAVELLGQAAQGLHDAHEATTPMGQPLGIVHRDVSPQNILVGLDGRVRITDFGVARAILRLSQTTTGQLKGKFAYFAPEQVKGGSNIDKRSDVFALGIVAWETLTGRRLFAAENPMATMDLVRSMPIPNPTELRPDLPPAVADVVMAALDREVSRRMKSAGEFAHKLRSTARKSGMELPHGDVISQYVKATGGEQLVKIQRSIKRALAHQETATDIHLEPNEIMSLDEPTPTNDGTRSGIVESQAGGGTRRGPTLETAALKPRPQLMVEPASQPSQPSHPSNPSVPGHPRYAREQSQPAFVGQAPGQIGSWPSGASAPSITPILESPPPRGGGKVIAFAVIAVIVAALAGGGIAVYSSGGLGGGEVSTPLPPAPTGSPTTAAPPAEGLGAPAPPIAPDPQPQLPVAPDPALAQGAADEPAEDVEPRGTGSRRTGASGRRRTGSTTTGSAPDLSQVAAAAERRGQATDPEPPVRTEPVAQRTTEPAPQQTASDPPPVRRERTGSGSSGTASSTTTTTQTQTPAPTKRGPGFMGTDAFDTAAARRRRQGTPQ